jgi:hypothetical protein
MNGWQRERGSGPARQMVGWTGSDPARVSGLDGWEGMDHGADASQKEKEDGKGNIGPPSLSLRCRSRSLAARSAELK